MDFAKRYLQNCGWEEGDGLGKEKQGILTAIKPKIKFDKEGIGYENTADVTNKNQWWCHAYNLTAKGKKCEFRQTQVGVKMIKRKRRDSKEFFNLCDETESKYKKKFVKSGRIKGMDFHKVLNSSSSEDSSDETKEMKNLNLEKIYKISKGNTCHKAARIGLRLSGKLKRLEAQEENFLKQRHK